MRQVIFAWSYLEWGGAQIYFLSIIKHAPENWHFKILLPAGSSPEIVGFFTRGNTEVEFLEGSLDNSPPRSAFHRLARQLKRISAERRLYKRLESIGFSENVFHIEAGPWQSWTFLGRVARRSNVFVTMHNSLPIVERWREILWKRRFRFLFDIPGFHLFTSNKDTKESLSRFIEPSDLERVKVTYTTVDPGEIDEVLAGELDRSAIRTKHGIPEGKRIVLCVGQFIDRKGRWVYLEAAKRILSTENDVVFVWLTPAMPSDEDRVTIDSYGLGENFKLVLSGDAGSSRQEILRFFRIAAIFALPSFREGLPISLLEAMALGIPSVSTRINAIPEAIIDGRTGLLVEAGDAEGLAHAILKLKRDPELSAEISAAGREHVIRNFDERAVSAIAIQSYEEALSNGQ